MWLRLRRPSGWMSDPSIGVAARWRERELKRLHTACAFREDKRQKQQESKLGSDADATLLPPPPAVAAAASCHLLASRGCCGLPLLPVVSLRRSIQSGALNSGDASAMMRVASLPPAARRCLGCKFIMELTRSWSVSWESLSSPHLLLGRTLSLLHVGVATSPRTHPRRTRAAAFLSS